MPKRIETSQEMLLSVESAYEHKDAEQMIQEIQQAIPAIQQSLQRAIAEGDRYRVDELQARLQEHENALVAYQEALPRQQAERERDEQRRRENVEDFGRADFPQPSNRRYPPPERGYTTPDRLKTQIVPNPKPIQPEYEKPEGNSPLEKEIAKGKRKARKQLREKALEAIGEMRGAGEDGWMDTNAIVERMMENPEVVQLLNDQFSGVREELAQQVEKVKKAPKTKLYDDTRAVDIKADMKIPRFLKDEVAPLSISDLIGRPEETNEDEEDTTDVDEYGQYVQETQARATEGAYNQWVEENAAAFRAAKKPVPTFQKWVRDIRTDPYPDWSIKKSPEFQEFVQNELEIARRVKGGPLTDKEQSNLLSNLGFDAFSAHQERLEGGDGERGPGIGIRDYGAPPADLNKVRSPEALVEELQQKMQDAGLPANPEQFGPFAEKLWVGEMEKKMGDLLMYDPEIKKHLRFNAYKIRDVANSVNRDKREADMGVAAFENMLKADLKENKTAWINKYKENMEKIEKDPSRKDPSIRGNKNEVILSELKRWIIQRIYESGRRMTRKFMEQRRRQESLNDRRFNQEMDREDVEIRDENAEFEDNSAKEMDLETFKENYSDEVASYVAGTRESFKNIYDLLYNENSDVFIGDVNPSPDQIHNAYNQIWRVRGDERRRPVSRKTVDNVRSDYLKAMNQYMQEDAQNADQKSRIDGMRDQIGVSGPTKMDKPKKTEPRQQGKPTKKIKNVRDMMREFEEV